LFPVRAEDRHGAPEAAETAGAARISEAEERRAVVEMERRLAEERTAALEAIATAREQGRSEERQLFEQTLAAERRRLQAQMLQSLEEFRIERQRYFHHVEAEVVRLSLAIAARVLHRETHLDPMLLAGAVRVALDKLANSSSVVMRVAPAEVPKWQQFFRTAGNSRIQPGVLEDPSLAAGECLLVTELGTIELGVRAQLEEIEKGFYDLLDRRPSGAVQCGAAANGTKSSS
jgi:flagellar assembly protein FliH